MSIAIGGAAMFDAKRTEATFQYIRTARSPRVIDSLSIARRNCGGMFASAYCCLISSRRAAKRRSRFGDALVARDRGLVASAADVDFRQRFLHLGTIDVGGGQDRLQLRARLVVLVLPDQLLREEDARRIRGGIDRQRFAQKADRFLVRRRERRVVELIEERWRATRRCVTSAKSGAPGRDAMSR